MKSIVISVAAALAITVPGYAAPDQSGAAAGSAPLSAGATHAAAVNAAATKAELSKLSAKLQNAFGISYKSTISYLAQNDSPAQGQSGFQNKLTSTKVSVERPAKLSVIVSNPNGDVLGALSSDGSKLLMYDASVSKYSIAGTAPDLQSTMQSLQVAGQTVFAAPDDAGVDLRTALGFPFSFLTGHLEAESAPPGGSLAYSMTTATVNGAATDVLTEKLTSPQSGAIKLIILVDHTTGLPAGQKVVSLPPGGRPPMTILEETFSDLHLLTSAADQSVFNFKPPVSAALVMPQLTAPPTGQQPAAPDNPGLSTTPPAPGVPSAPAAPGQSGAAPSSPSPGPTQIPLAPGSPKPPAPMPPPPPI